MLVKNNFTICVVIPCYRVEKHILEVLQSIGPEVDRIYVIDDSCPNQSGTIVEQRCVDSRVSVIHNRENLGVGGAVMAGYRAAINDGMDIAVKLDGDGQMDPRLLYKFVCPIIAGQADYTKGNRFFDLDEIRAMPKLRLFGNAVLSFMTKVSSGYWDVFDPTNGYTAIHTDVIKHLPLDKISQRYFFETDMLFRLNIHRAVVLDIPMEAKYGDEISNLKVKKIILEFSLKHMRNTFKRIFYNYYLRDLSLASLELPIGLFMLIFGTLFGAYHWVTSAETGVPTPAGTVMLAAMPVLMGLQFVLAFIGYDIASIPTKPRQSGGIKQHLNLNRSVR